MYFETVTLNSIFDSVVAALIQALDQLSLTIPEKIEVENAQTFAFKTF